MANAVIVPVYEENSCGGGSEELATQTTDYFTSVTISEIEEENENG